jgi:hypothetical protein
VPGSAASIPEKSKSLLPTSAASSGIEIDSESTAASSDAEWSDD